MRKILLFTLICLLGTTAFAQKTVLFLLPIGADKANQVNLQDVHTQQDIERTFDKSLIYFWEGAQIAIDELREEGNDLHLIVRDITDASQLEQTLHALSSQPIDLIIAPVYGKLFPIVADFAHRHKIPTVNPFSSRHDIIEGNPFIYKVLPALDSRPATLAERYPNANFIVCTNPERATHDADTYINYFSTHHIAYHTLADTASFHSYLSPTKPNVVISTFLNPAAFQKVTAQLLQKNNLPAFTWVVPEEWLGWDEFNLDNLRDFNLHYFTNHYMDKTAENVQVFTYKFGEQFHGLPTTENYAFQGYDLTKFFISLIINDFIIPDFEPLVYRFQFERVAKGGFENKKARLIQWKNYKFQEVL